MTKSTKDKKEIAQVATIAANNGETVMIGGLVTKIDSRTENKVPVFGDIPVLGSLFRYRSRLQKRTELIVILTPHVIRSRADEERVLADRLVAAKAAMARDAISDFRNIVLLFLRNLRAGRSILHAKGAGWEGKVRFGTVADQFRFRRRTWPPNSVGTFSRSRSCENRR
jgi:hypothetical protein